MAAALTSERQLIRHPTLWREAPLVVVLVDANTTQQLDLEDCPREVLLHVASFLADARDLARFGCVCRATRAAALDDALWKRLCVDTFPLPAEDRAPPDGWKALYRCVIGWGCWAAEKETRAAPSDSGSFLILSDSSSPHTSFFSSAQLQP